MNPETGEVFEPTLDWYCQIWGERVVDGQQFYTRERLDHEILENPCPAQIEDYVQTVTRNAVMSLASFGACDCVLGKACDRHLRS